MVVQEDKIIQIVPATGLRAKYKSDDGSFFTGAIQIIALHESGTMGLYSADSLGCFGEVDDSVNFDSIVFTKEEEDWK